MIRLIAIPTVLGLALAAGVTLSNSYEEDRTLRIEAKSTIEMETTSSSMERDGEPVEGRFGGAGASSEETRTVVQLDTVLANDDGTPTKVRRVYESVEGGTTRTFGENSMDQELESAFSGVELVLALEDGDLVVEVTDGEEPDDELLAGLYLEMALDALLPDDEVDVDDTWEIDADVMNRLLGLDMNEILFQRPEPEEREPRGEGGRGGRGRGMRGRGGTNVLALLTSDEWEGEATLVSEEEETDEGTGALIEFEAECSGDLPEREDRGGRSFAALLVPAVAAVPENTFEIELEGKMIFSVEEKRPLYLEVEASITIETYREFSRGDMVMTMASTQEGAFEYVVSVTVEEE